MLSDVLHTKNTIIRKEHDMVYRITTEDRKPVIARLKQLAGDRLIYTRMPRCAYEVDGISVEKDLTVVTGENADMGLINILLDECLITDAAAQAEEPEQDGAEPGDQADMVHAEISFPIDGHTGNSLRNLVFMLYSRGNLISQATGGPFGADRELVDKLRAAEPEEVRGMIRNGKQMKGMEISETSVMFTGFPETEDPEEVQVFMQLAAAMNKASIEQKRIQPKQVQEENEKYAFRTWMVRLGMGGSGFKEARKRLLRDLDGNSAFRTEADRERWTQRMKERKGAKHDVSE